jgi:hypothetical protein
MFAVDLPSSCKGKDYGRAGRTANIKDNCAQTQRFTMPGAVKWFAMFIEGRVFLTFWPLNRKLKEKFLCDLGDSSEAGGESIS